MVRKAKSGMESFEERLARLEELVTRLETGNLPLENAVDTFEEGMKLSQSLAATLQTAEKRVEVLLAGENGQVVVKPLEIETTDDEDEPDEEQNR